MAAILLALATLTANNVTFKGLLEELSHPERLATFPNPEYQSLQASSYNRESTHRDKPGWFADSDGTGYIRTEQINGKTEWVMMEHAGPGCLTKFWTPFFYYDFNNRTGPNINIYLDGSKTPVFSESYIKLVTGQGSIGAPWAAYSARAGNLYLPIPFGKSAKVTMSEKPFYFIINYRAYPQNTKVESFTRDLLTKNKKDLETAALRLNPQPITDNNYKVETIQPGKSLEIELPKGSRRISELAFKLIDAENRPETLRSTVLSAEFDANSTIWCPIGDFFCSSDSVHPFETLTRFTRKPNQMVTKWSMPYKNTAKLRLTNYGSQPQMVSYRVKTEPNTWTARTMHFHCRWRPDDIIPGTPFIDWNFVDIKGKGVYVGDAWTVLNIRPNSWWGEGDEKVWVDGEKFPSWFGTGTEDYFSYAWSNPEKYERPFHAQPRADGPGCGGQIANVRWHVTDDIPFTKSIKFELERWHWQDVPATFSGTAFWYAEPTAWTAPRVKVKNLFLTEYQPAKPVAGAIEGEKLPVAKTGGTTEVQGFDDLSSGEQLWWRDAREGETLTLTVNVPKAGTYEVVGNLCHARDYGVHTLTLGGQPLGRRDFYSADLKWKKVSLGTVTLPAGAAALVVKCDGHNEKAEPRHMFGLDYLKLVAK